MKKLISIILATAMLLMVMPILADDQADEGEAMITLSVVNGATTDGSYFQMLFDADANEYGDTIPASGNRFGGGYYGCMSKYAKFEYKVPENADGDWMTSDDGVYDGESCTVTIPAGVYDWVIVNACPYDDDLGSYIFVVSDAGNCNGRADDYVIEADKHYTFTVRYGNHGRVDLEITDVEPEAPMFGDVDGNNEVNIIDSLIVLRASLEIITLTEEQETLADVNHDALINMNDALLIQRYALGLINSFEG